MGELMVSPGDVRGVGSDVASIGPDISGLAGDLAGMGGLASEPPATAAALARLSSEWSSGAQRLGADVVALGRLTEAVAHLYVTVDAEAIR